MYRVLRQDASDLYWWCKRHFPSLTKPPDCLISLMLPTVKTLHSATSSRNFLKVVTSLISLNFIYYVIRCNKVLGIYNVPSSADILFSYPWIWNQLFWLVLNLFHWSILYIYIYIYIYIYMYVHVYMYIYLYI